MAFGLGRLGWSPETFWAATPHEIDAALRAHRTGQSPAVPGRDALRALMAAHPDA
ncbi:MAG TPA: phage tail assembly chaperone [Bosea sp. (in: a-proteobacteria)]|jgi:uncharacterized phage protein (TIGR02216 family)|nr:phage tail assembly chaperone [Bosea sp. (in: a-proteobacteria)]